jgi:hypothetical protein
VTTLRAAPAPAALRHNLHLQAQQRLFATAEMSLRVVTDPAAFAEGSPRQALLSPGKQAALSKLREQELSLDKQQLSIQAIIQQLDSSFGHTPTPSAPSTPHTQIETRPPWAVDTPTTPDSSISLASRQLRSAKALREQALEALLSETEQRPDVEVQEVQEVQTIQAVFGSPLSPRSPSALQAQLHRMRAERVEAIGRRAAEQQQTLHMMQTVKARALLEARHCAAMEAALEHFKKRRCWLLIRVLYNSLRSRNTLALGEIRWRFVAVRDAFKRIHTAAHFRAMCGIGASYVYQVVRLKAGWRRFRRAFSSQLGGHLRLLAGDLRAADSLVRRRCGAVLSELGRLVRRKYLTGKLIEQRRKAAMCAGVLETLLVRAGAGGVRRGRVLGGQRSREQGKVAAALLAWVDLARQRGRRRRRLGLGGRSGGRSGGALLGGYSAGRLRGVLAQWLASSGRRVSLRGAVRLDQQRKLSGVLERLARRGGALASQRRERRGAWAEHTARLGAWALREWARHTVEGASQAGLCRTGQLHRVDVSSGLYARRVAGRALHAWRRHTQVQ